MRRVVVSLRRVSLGDVVGSVVLGARLLRIGDCVYGGPGIIPSRGGSGGNCRGDIIGKSKPLLLNDLDLSKCSNKSIRMASSFFTIS